MDSKEVCEALERYSELKRQEGELKRQIEEIKPMLVDYIKGELQGKPLEWAGLRATVSAKSRRTLVGESVERIFGVTLTDDCYKTTTYPELKVARIDG